MTIYNMIIMARKKTFRKFDGRIFRNVGSSKTKKLAKDRANKLRMSGKKVRITKTKEEYPYQIYARSYAYRK